MAFKPLLAAKLEKYKLEDLKFPMYASPKIDGIRVVIKDGVALSRRLKSIPNRRLFKALSSTELSGFDGEIVVGSHVCKQAFNTTQSGVMSRGGPGVDQVKYLVFDDFTYPDDPYSVRLEALCGQLEYLHRGGLYPYIQPVDQTFLTTPAQARELADKYIAEGYEGLMLRSPKGRYKFGRSTERDQILIKLKPFEDAEAKIVGFEELMHNANEQKRDALGRAKRSSHKANMVPMNTLGALVCESDEWEYQFNIGTGFTQKQRDELWAQRKKLIGKTVNFRYQAHGSKDRPRMPSFRGIRYD